MIYLKYIFYIAMQKVTFMNSTPGAEKLKEISSLSITGVKIV